MARHLVTGCAGFVGSHLYDALLGRGDEVVGIDRFSDHHPRALKEANIAGAMAHPRFRLVEGDLCDLDLDPLAESADGVFHLAAQPGVRGSWGGRFAGYARDNLVATQRVAEAASRAGARMLLASSSSVYGDASRHPTAESDPLRPISPYGVTRQACESIVAAYAATRGLDGITLRLFTVYGPRQRPDMAFSLALDSAEEGLPFTVLGDGTQTRDVTYVGDAVRAALLAMERAPSGAVHNVGGGSEIPLIEALRTIERTCGLPLPLAFAETAAADPARRIRRGHRGASRRASRRGELRGAAARAGLRVGARSRLSQRLGDSLTRVARPRTIGDDTLLAAAAADAVRAALVGLDDPSRTG